MEITKRNKIIAGGLVLVGLLFLVSFLISGASTRGKVVVEVSILPEDSAFTIDGKPAKPGRVALTKGTHTLKATRKHFEDAVKKIDTETIDRNEIIYLLPQAKSDEALDYLLTHEELQAERERIISGVEFPKSQEEILEKNPVLSSLPYQTLDYKIDYTVGEDNIASYQITLYPAAAQPGTPEYETQVNSFKSQALQYLESKGLRTQKADITYIIK